MLRAGYRHCILSTLWIASRASPPRFFSKSAASVAMHDSVSNVDPPVAAVAQLRSTSNKFDNLLNVARCAGWSKRRGACMLFLPECFGFMGESSAATLREAEPPLDDSSSSSGVANAKAVSNALMDTIAASVGGLEYASLVERGEDDLAISLLDGLRTIARESGLWISAGGMHIGGAPPDSEDDAGGSRVYNTHVILDNFGAVMSSYRKIHLFDLDIPGEMTLKESNTTAPGSELILCDSPLGRLGLTTCYDIRFPEQYTELVKRGAEIILVPSAFTVPTGTAHWHLLLRARAVEAQCYVIAAAQFGKHNLKRESYGHSLIVDPWGTVVADAGGIDGGGTAGEAFAEPPPSIITAEINLELLQSTRQRIPIQLHRENARF